MGAEAQAAWQMRFEAYAEASPRPGGRVHPGPRRVSCRRAGTRPAELDGRATSRSRPARRPASGHPRFAPQDPDLHRRLGRPQSLDQHRDEGRWATSQPPAIGRRADQGADSAAGRAMPGATSTSASASTRWAAPSTAWPPTAACIPFGATFLVFSDYMRPAIRLAALSHLKSDLGLHPRQHRGR